MFDFAEQRILSELGDRLRAKGWAEHATVEFLLGAWLQLSTSVDRYRHTVDDYTNDLTSRDGLELAIADCPEPLRAKLTLQVQGADREFLARTNDDTEHRLGRYFRVDPSSAWWWKRVPRDGALAKYLDADDASSLN